MEPQTTNQYVFQPLWPRWFRPVAPMIADEALAEVFGREVRSPWLVVRPSVGAGGVHQEMVISWDFLRDFTQE